MSTYILKCSSRKDKKFQVSLPNGKTVHFGQKGYSDYTKHKDSGRMKSYLNRHEKRENWKKSGTNTAGFWARWILWNKPTLTSSIRNTAKKFNIKIKYGNTIYK